MLTGGDIKRVGFEVDEFRAFDDVVVEYVAPRPDGRGGTVSADYYQVKFSATYTKEISADALMDPTFINATKVSLLERLRDAATICLRDHRSVRFVLVSPWRIASGDILAELVDTTSGALRINTLQEGTTARSATFSLREKWRKHLNVSEDELCAILRFLFIRFRPLTLEEARRDLNPNLNAAGFIPISDLTVTDPYSQLIWKLSTQGVQWFTPADVVQACEQEQLCRPSTQIEKSEPCRVLGVRTFMRWAETLEDETDAMVCLTEHFSQRQVRDPGLWESAILPGLRDFLSQEIQAGKAVELELQTHNTLAFSAGYLIEPKAGVKVGIRQRGIAGTSVWRLESPTRPRDSSVAALISEREEVFAGSGPLACAISVTHSIEHDVRAFAERDGGFSKLLCLSVAQPYPQAVRDGHHAFEIAEASIRAIKTRLSAGASGPVQLFMAIPNGMAFLLGQLARTLGDIQLYEFDFG